MLVQIDSMKKLIDDYVKVRKKIDKLSNQESDLRRKLLEIDTDTPAILCGYRYKVKKLISHMYTVNPSKLFKLVTPRQFFACIRVNITHAEGYIPREKLIQISDVHDKISLKVNL